MAGRGLVSFVCKSGEQLLSSKPQITTFSRNVNIKGRCTNNEYEPPVCKNPCKKCNLPPKKPKPCPKKSCLPPIHMCPYDDPCFHCPYTPPPCPKRKDPCCPQPCCPPFNPYKYRDVCCLPRHPDRIIDPKCPDHCRVKRKACCPCCVCDGGPLKCEREHNTSCCPPKPPVKDHCCLKVFDKKACPMEPDCVEPPCVSKCEKVPCIKQRGDTSCHTTR